MAKPVIAWALVAMLSRPHLSTVGESECVPRWRETALAARDRAAAAGLGRLTLRNCSLSDAGVVPCDPREMRAAVESQLQASGLYQRPLSLATYSVARNISSEAGSGTIAEKVAIAEAALNRAQRDGLSVTGIMLRDGRYYAKQRGKNPRVASSRDPKLEDVVIADLVLDGKTGNYARGATHYFSPAAMDWLYRNGQATKDRWAVFERWAAGGLAWVGEIPSIDPERQFFMKDADVRSAYWRRQYDAARRVLATPIARPEPATCPPFSWGFAGLATLFVGAVLAATIWQSDQLPWDLT